MKYRKYNHLFGGESMKSADNSITKDECEEFVSLEKKLNKEQKRAVLYVMKGIIIGELARESIEKNKA